MAGRLEIERAVKVVKLCLLCDSERLDDDE